MKPPTCPYRLPTYRRASCGTNPHAGQTVKIGTSSSHVEGCRPVRLKYRRTMHPVWHAGT
ncbi:hypothetical protein [Deinococcus aquaticus]|uniref:hypothetical protein n=1 Tax=Deinococcus aquaticus TaxID=328692 RepID=UPI00361EFF08